MIYEYRRGMQQTNAQIITSLPTRRIFYMEAMDGVVRRCGHAPPNPAGRHPNPVATTRRPTNALKTKPLLLADRPRSPGPDARRYWCRPGGLYHHKWTQWRVRMWNSVARLILYELEYHCFAFAGESLHYSKSLNRKCFLKPGW